MKALRWCVVAAILLFATRLISVSLATGAEHAPLHWRGGGIVREAGISMRYPAGWHAARLDGSIAVASFAPSGSWLAAERRSVPEGGVFIWAFTYGRLPHSSDSLFPLRAERLQLDPKTLAFYECGLRLDGYMIRFREHGRAMQAEVALGAGADRSAALAVLNRLRVS